MALRPSDPVRWLAIAGLVLLALTAGCLGADEAGEGQPATDAEEEQAPGTLEAPEWSLGDHWTYVTGEGDEQTWAITGQTRDAWIVDTDGRQAAFFDARFDVSFFGERGKRDISGSQGNTQVLFFDWPLEANKTWTTTWDGVEREITVDRVEDGIAHLRARQAGRVAVEYTYDASAGHFGSYTFLDENGTEAFSAELQDSGSNWTGTALRWQLDKPVDEQGTFGAQPVSWGFEFEVDEAVTDLWLDLAIECPSGTYTFGFGGNDSGYDNSEACPAEAEEEEGIVVEDPGPGTYNGGFTGTSPEEDGSYDITLYVRTLQEVAVGEG